MFICLNALFISHEQCKGAGQKKKNAETPEAETQSAIQTHTKGVFGYCLFC